MLPILARLAAGASRVGAAARAGASRVGAAARAGASRVGAAARAGASRVGAAARAGASRVGAAARGGASRIGALGDRLSASENFSNSKASEISKRISDVQDVSDAVSRAQGRTYTPQENDGEYTSYTGDNEHRSFKVAKKVLGSKGTVLTPLQSKQWAEWVNSQLDGRLDEEILRELAENHGGWANRVERILEEYIYEEDVKWFGYVPETSVQRKIDVIKTIAGKDYQNIIEK